MAAGEEYLRRRGFAEATLWVLEDNYLGRGFYDKLGWTEDGACRDRPGRNELRYRKRLDVQ
jgi:hypothetical protein